MTLKSYTDNSFFYRAKEPAKSNIDTQTDNSLLNKDFSLLYLIAKKV